MNIDQAKNLADLTTFKVGGDAEFFCEVENKKHVIEAVVYAKKNLLAISIIGEGSNLLCSDSGVKGLVMHISMKGMSHTQDGDVVFLTSYSGEALDDVVAYAVDNGWWGIENLSHIPGTVGATPVQNVGAYGVEVKDIVSSVEVYNTDTETFESLSAEQCNFGYRDSIFKKEEGRKYIVVSVTYRLSMIENPQLKYKDLATYFSVKKVSLANIRNSVIEIRSNKFPDWRFVGTAGSFFKNPIVSNAKFNELKITYPELPGFKQEDGSVKISLGWVIDKVLNLKGVQNGNVGTYKSQALVLINYGKATSTEIENFAHSIESKVKEKIGISIEWEVTKIK